MDKRQLTVGILVAVIVIFGGLLLTRRSSSNKTTDQTAGVATTQPMATDMGMTSSATDSAQQMASSAASPAMTGAIKTFTVTGSNYAFSPAKLTVNKGDTVKITFVNSGGLHDLVFDDFNAQTKKIPTGQQDTITFSADKTGTFTYYCSVANHKAMGMQGTLTVQ